MYKSMEDPMRLSGRKVPLQKQGGFTGVQKCCDLREACSTEVVSPKKEKAAAQEGEIALENTVESLQSKVLEIHRRCDAQFKTIDEQISDFRVRVRKEDADKLVT